MIATKQRIGVALNKIAHLLFVDIILFYILKKSNSISILGPSKAPFLCADGECIESFVNCSAFASCNGTGCFDRRCIPSNQLCQKDDLKCPLKTPYLYYFKKKNLFF